MLSLDLVRFRYTGRAILDSFLCHSCSNDKLTYYGVDDLLVPVPSVASNSKFYRQLKMVSFNLCL